MALKNIIAPRQQVQNSQSKAVAGGNVFLYQPGTTTFITSYFDSGLVQPHANPVRLSGSGRANIWITQDCDLRVEDKNGNLILEELNANPDAVGVDQGGGLVPNGSFETDADADLIPDGWTLVSEIGATNALDTSQSTDGAQSFRFTSSGNGGGSLTTTDFFPVNDTDNLNVSVDMFASIATVLNIVRVEWYDISFVSISNSDAYSSTANPLTWTTQDLLVTPPANARFAKLVLIGGDPSVPLAGSSWWDRVNVFYPAIVSGTFDNITIQNNEIITTNINGQLDIRPNGTGPVNMQSSDDVDLVDINNPLNVMQIYPATSQQHLALGEDIIQSKQDATTAARLLLNPLGGNLSVGSGDIGDPTVPDAITSLLYLADQSDNFYAQLGFDAGTTLELHSQAEGGLVHVIGEQAGSGQVVMGEFNPDGEVNLYHQGAIKFSTAANGIFSRGSVVTADPGTTEAVDSRLVLQGLNATYNLAVIGYEGNNNLAFRNRMESGHVRLAASATGGTVRNLLIGDPDADVGLYQVGVEVARTLTAAAGGFQVNNTLTGAGFERVLTATDLSGLSLNTLSDVTLTSPATGGVLYKSAGNWLDTDAIEINPATLVTLKYGGVDVLETAPVSGAAYPYVLGSGGVIINNSTTGNGDSRALTYYDNRMAGKVGTTSRNLTTAVTADPDLQWTGLRAGRHSFEFYIQFQSINAAAAFVWEIDGTNVTGGNCMYEYRTIDGTPSGFGVAAPMGTQITVPNPTGGEVFYMRIYGTVLISTNGGTCEFRWGPSTSQIDSTNVFNGGWGRCSPFRIT
jgi:hypothetical protein